METPKIHHPAEWVQARLKALHNRSTTYELLAKHPDGRIFLIAYSDRKTFHAIFQSIQKRGPQIVKALGVPADAEFTLGKRVSDPATIGEWKIAFSGRTQRDAVCEGTYPYVGTVGAVDAPEGKAGE